MIGFDYLLFFFLLAILAVVSYEDYKERLIRNKYIVLIFFIGIFYQFVSGNGFSFRVVMFMSYALLIGFSMWFLGLWPAGDAKLFAVLVLFLPESYLKTGIILNYSVNIFVPIFFVLTGYVLIKGRERFLEGIKFAFNPYRVFILMVILLGFVGWIVKGLSLIGISISFFVVLLVLFVSFELFNMVSSFRTEIVFTFLAVLRIILDFETVYSTAYLYQFSSMILLFVVLRFFVIYMVYYFYGRQIDIEDLEPGMSPSEGIVRREDGFEKISFMNSSFIDYMRQRKEDFIHNIIELTEEDIEKIKGLKEEGELAVKTLMIDRTQHFAFMICIGFLITFFTGTDVITYLQSLL